jgi:MarR-like DNA-binding transcriptional regulator SgrR of sgrS sRNA
MLEPTVAFDSAPLSTDLSFIADYTAINLYSAVSAQLFRWNESRQRIVPCACANWSASDNWRYFRFKVAHGLRWEDGSNVEAGDYLRRFSEILSSNAPIAIRFEHVRDIAVECDEDGRESIAFRLAFSDTQLPNKLAHPALGPLRARNDAPHYPAAAGPFHFVEFNRKGGTLERENCTHDRLNSIHRMHFVYISNPDEAIARYENGSLDATCPASFPLARLNEFAERKDLVRGPDNTFIVLLPMSERAQEIAYRRAIADCIDLTQIICSFPGGLELADGFTQRPKSSPYSDQRADALGTRRQYWPRHKLLLGEKIRLAYDDFYPNCEITMMISEQLHESGADVEVIADDYRNPYVACDFRLAVLMNSVAYPADIYRRLTAASSFIHDPEFAGKYWRALRAYDEAETADGRLRSVEDLDNILKCYLPIIPIARLNQFSLKRRSLDAFSWTSDESWICV